MTWWRPDAESGEAASGGGLVRVTRERSSLPVADDLVDAVTVEVHRPSRPRGPAVLLTHGAGRDLDAPHLISLADAVAATGTLVVRANQPWKESGRAAPPPAPRAVPGYAAVAAAVRAAVGPRRGWVVGGHSNGARLTTHALASPDHPVRAIGALLISFPLHAPGKPIGERLDHWPHVAVPVLVLQGGNDPFGGADELRSHLTSLAGPALLHEVPGADHGFAVPSTRSEDGQRHEPDEVAGGLGGVVEAWLAGLA